jgi:hypothetical protein
MTFGHIETLADGKLYALQNAFKLDGRASAYPANARGYSTSNCYLLTCDGHGLLLDTGFTAHASAILSQIETVAGRDVKLSVYPMRLNEFMSVCNVEAIAGRFNVERCYSGNPDAALWVDFGGRSDAENQEPYDLKTALVAHVQTLFVAPKDQRPVDAFQAPIRLINTRWIYDRETRTLFTSDSFTQEWCETPEGPWISDVEDSRTTRESMRSFLLNTRYWWLEGGKTDALRKKLADVFDKHDIETIAPGYGRIHRGRAAVERQFQIFDDVLRDLDRGLVTAKYVDRDEIR